MPVDISRHLTQTIYTAARTGEDATGTPTYAAAISRAAGVEYAQGVAREGQQGTVSRTRATIITLAAIGPQDRVWLPGAAVDAIQASLADPDDEELAAIAASLARQPDDGGCQPAVALGESSPSFYQTTV